MMAKVNDPDPFGLGFDNSESYFFCAKSAHVSANTI